MTSDTRTPLVYSRAERRCDTCGGESSPGYLDNSDGRARFPCPDCNGDGDGRVSVDCTVECEVCGGSESVEHRFGHDPCPAPDCVSGQVPADWAGVHVGDAVNILRDGTQGVVLSTEEGLFSVAWKSTPRRVGVYPGHAPMTSIALDLDGDQGHRLACNRFKNTNQQEEA